MRLSPLAILLSASSSTLKNGRDSSTVLISHLNKVPDLAVPKDELVVWGTSTSSLTESQEQLRIRPYNQSTRL